MKRPEARTASVVVWSLNKNGGYVGLGHVLCVRTCLKCEGSQAVEQLSRESVKTDCSVALSEI